jgi:hypothetical protein
VDARTVKVRCRRRCGVGLELPLADRKDVAGARLDHEGADPLAAPVQLVEVELVGRERGPERGRRLDEDRLAVGDVDPDGSIGAHRVVARSLRTADDHAVAELRRPGRDARDLVADLARLLPQQRAARVEQRDVALRLVVDDEVAGDDQVAVLVEGDRGAERGRRLENVVVAPVLERLRPAGDRLTSGRSAMPSV